MNPHLQHVGDFPPDSAYAAQLPYGSMYAAPARSVPSMDEHARGTDDFDEDAKADSLFERPLKKAKLEDDSPAVSLGVTPGVVLMPSGPLVPPMASTMVHQAIPPVQTHHPLAAPAQKYTSSVQSDGFKFQPGAEAEYFIPDEDLYWSFGWLRVRIISRGKKQIGSKLLPHYVVEPLDGEDKTRTTVEEWQLRPTNKNTTGMQGKRLQKHTRVEVHSVFEESGRSEMWFCAEMSEDSAPTEDFVRVRYRNNRWNSVGKTATSVSKVRLRPVPMEDLHPPAGVSAKIWSIGGSRLPIRLLSDEEHKVQELYHRFDAIRTKWAGIPKINPMDFEADRDALNELSDSLNNARHYQKTREIIDFLLDIHSKFE